MLVLLLAIRVCMWIMSAQELFLLQLFPGSARFDARLTRPEMKWTIVVVDEIKGSAW